MDDFINKVKQGVFKAKDEGEKYLKTAAAKTKTAIDQTKLKYSVSEFEGKIKAIYTELGEILYNEFKDGAEFEGDIAEKCQKISEFKDEIATLKTKIAELSNMGICGECGAEVPEGAAFCPKCGAKVEDDGGFFEKAGEKVKDAAETVCEKAEDVVETVVEKVENAFDGKDE